MNKILCVCCLLLIHGTSTSQSKSSIVGKWKVFSVSDQNMYFNLKTDSFSVSEELKLMHQTPEKQDELVKFLVSLWQNLEYHFTEDGKFQGFQNDTIPSVRGKYREDKKAGIMEWDVLRINGIVQTGKVIYRIRNEWLYLTFSEKDKQIAMIFERMTEIR